MKTWSMPRSRRSAKSWVLVASVTAGVVVSVAVLFVPPVPAYAAPAIDESVSVLQVPAIAHEQVGTPAN